MKFNPMVETYRIRSGQFATSTGKPYGGFRIPHDDGAMMVIVGGGEDTGWEHVSCSFGHRCPTWDEMARVKDLFWGDDECVVQFHPPKAEYVNRMPYCLHLWRKHGENWETPPKALIG